MSKVAPTGVGGTGSDTGLARAATDKAIAAFKAALSNTQHLASQPQPWSKAMTALDASLLIARAKASILDIDAASARRPNAHARQAMQEIYSALSTVVPGHSTATDGGWLNPMNRKNAAAVQALGELVSKLTKT